MQQSEAHSNPKGRLSLRSSLNRHKKTEAPRLHNKRTEMSMYSYVRSTVDQYGCHRFVRSIVYGGLDGIISMFALVASTRGAYLGTPILFVIGVANLVADSFSMAVSDYLATLAEQDKERYDHSSKIKDKLIMRSTLYDYFINEGFNQMDANEMISLLEKNDKSLAHLANLIQESIENESSLSPRLSATYTFISFLFFGFIPILTFLIAPMLPGAAMLSPFTIALALTLTTLFMLGLLQSFVADPETTLETNFKNAFRTLLVGGTTALTAYYVSHFLNQSEVF